MTRFLLALAFAGSLGAATIEGDIRDITGTAALNTAVRFTPLSFPTTDGDAVVAGPARTIVPREGKFTNTFAPGDYRVAIGSFTFDIGVPEGTNTYTLPELATAGLTTYLWTNPLPYTVAAGTNIVIQTNATTYTISAEASGTGGTNSILWAALDGDVTATGSDGVEGFFTAGAGDVFYTDMDYPVSEGGSSLTNITENSAVTSVTNSLTVWGDMNVQGEVNLALEGVPTYVWGNLVPLGDVNVSGNLLVEGEIQTGSQSFYQTNTGTATLMGEGRNWLLQIETNLLTVLRDATINSNLTVAGTINGTATNATALQNVLVTNAAPSENQILKYDGHMWAPAADNDTIYTLPDYVLTNNQSTAVTFSNDVTVAGSVSAGTNTVSDAGSWINGVGMTNGDVRSASVTSAGLATFQRFRATTTTFASPGFHFNAESSLGMHREDSGVMLLTGTDTKFSGSVTASNSIILPAADMPTVAGTSIALWNSNGVLFAVGAAFTNQIAPPP